MKAKKESFIGILTDEEAIECRRKNDEWTKRFNEDFERRSKILFPK